MVVRNVKNAKKSSNVKTAKKMAVVVIVINARIVKDVNLNAKKINVINVKVMDVLLVMNVSIADGVNSAVYMKYVRNAS